MNPLNPREKRIVAIGILVAVIAIAWVGIISPLAEGFMARAAERHELLNIYARNQRVLEGIPVWRAQASAQNNPPADMPYSRRARCWQPRRSKRASTSSWPMRAEACKPSAMCRMTCLRGGCVCAPICN